MSLTPEEQALADNPSGPWYRLALHSAGAFHKPAQDWIRSGKALCGRGLARPALEVNNPMPRAQKLCAACVKAYAASVAPVVGVR